MGMDLSGAGGNERFSNTSLCKMLKLACEYGWKPARTEPGRWYDEKGELNQQMSPGPDEWNGSYLSNDFQCVTDKDAAKIANALERALDDIPDFDTNKKQVEYGPDDLPLNPLEHSLVKQGFIVTVPNESLSPVEFFSGEAKQRVRDFITFCRAGGFMIS